VHVHARGIKNVITGVSVGILSSELEDKTFTTGISIKTAVSVPDKVKAFLFTVISLIQYLFMTTESFQTGNLQNPLIGNESHPSIYTVDRYHHDCLTTYLLFVTFGFTSS